MLAITYVRLGRIKPREFIEHLRGCRAELYASGYASPITNEEECHRRVKHASNKRFGSCQSYRVNPHMFVFFIVKLIASKVSAPLPSCSCVCTLSYTVQIPHNLCSTDDTTVLSADNCFNHRIVKIAQVMICHCICWSVTHFEYAATISKLSICGVRRILECNTGRLE